MNNVLNQPDDLLKIALNKQVKIRVKDSKDITGLLQAFDEHYNILLTEAKELDKKIGTLYIRGDVVILLSIVN